MRGGKPPHKNQASTIQTTASSAEKSLLDVGAKERARNFRATRDARRT